MPRRAEIISDEEIFRVHGHANFGSMTPRQVIDDGVRKVAVGYQCGHTQFTILREHGLITKPRPGSYDCDLTKKGKAYGRVLFDMSRPKNVSWVGLALAFECGFKSHEKGQNLQDALIKFRQLITEPSPVAPDRAPG